MFNVYCIMHVFYKASGCFNNFSFVPPLWFGWVRDKLSKTQQLLNEVNTLRDIEWHYLFLLIKNYTAKKMFYKSLILTIKAGWVWHTSCADKIGLILVSKSINIGWHAWFNLPYILKPNRWNQAVAACSSGIYTL